MQYVNRWIWNAYHYTCTPKRERNLTECTVWPANKFTDYRLCRAASFPTCETFSRFVLILSSFPSTDQFNRKTLNIFKRIACAVFHWKVADKIKPKYLVVQSVGLVPHIDVRNGLPRWTLILFSEEKSVLRGRVKMLCVLIPEIIPKSQPTATEYFQRFGFSGLVNLAK